MRQRKETVFSCIADTNLANYYHFSSFVTENKRAGNFLSSSDECGACEWRIRLRLQWEAMNSFSFETYKKNQKVQQMLLQGICQMSATCSAGPVFLQQSQGKN